MKKDIPWNLIIASLKDELDEEGLSHLEEWNTSDENRKLFDEISQIWGGIQNLSATYTPDKDYYWQKLYARVQTDRKPTDRKPTNRKPKAELHAKKKTFNIFRYVAVASVILLLLVGTGAYWMIEDLRRQTQQEVQFSNLSGKSQVLLADGTKVWLHTNTSLGYKHNSQTGHREVKMSGEAFFEVAHDSKHPFVVQMNGMKLTVYGTKFNICDLPHSNEVQVSLQEGAVGLETSRASCRIFPGEKAFFNRTTNTLQITRRDVDFDISWAQKQIVFNQKPLGFICRYLAKWYSVEIVLEPDLMNKYLYTFTLRDEPLEEIMRLIAQINPINYSFNEENKLFISSKK